MKEVPASALAIAAAVRRHERTARSVADDALSRAERLQESWRAFIALTPDLARKQAEEVDRLVGQGRALPLAGVPFAVKDLIDVQDVPTTCGSRAFRDRTAKANATVVNRLLGAGAVPLGKLNMHECAFGFTGENRTFGDCRNPWDPERIAGGSSSGSAVAVALGICPVTLGSDTGGSVRLPAALCGVTGLKPTYGLISRAGGMPLSWTMDHIGPFTRSAEEAALVLAVLAGRDRKDASSSGRPVPDYGAELKRPLDGLKLGIPRPWFYDSLDSDVEQLVQAAINMLAALGARRVEIKLPHLEEALGAHRAIIFAEASAYYRPFLARCGDQFGDDIRPLLQAGLALPAADYLQAQRVRSRIRREWASVFREIDCLITPTAPIVASRFGQAAADIPGGKKPLVRALLDLTLPFNLTGHPAISVPCGFSQGLPAGLQIVGRPFEEGTILRVAHHYQQKTDWHRRMPPAE